MSDNDAYRNSLRAGYLLHWYRIDGVLGQGGFGITYLAFDNNLHRQVAIKEYLPMELAVREGDNSVYPASQQQDERFHWGLDRFLAEARTLAKFKHPGIVRVLSVFEANKTAYMVMEYEHGETLQTLLTRRKTLSEPEIFAMLRPILDGLELIHQSGFIHRDIKPANVFMRATGTPLLIDFGSARLALGQETRTLTSVVSPGYAPYEQYYSKSDRQGPWTDIYGFGATLYRAISGRAPMDAIDRSEAILKAEKDIFVSAREVGGNNYSKRLLAAIDRALIFNEKERPQSVAEWRRDLGLHDLIPSKPVSEWHPDPDLSDPASPRPAGRSPHAPVFNPNRTDFDAVPTTKVAVGDTLPDPTLPQPVASRPLPATTVIETGTRRKSLWQHAPWLVLAAIAIAVIVFRNPRMFLPSRPAQKTEVSTTASHDVASTSPSATTDIRAVTRPTEETFKPLAPPSPPEENIASPPPARAAPDKVADLLHSAGQAMEANQLDPADTNSAVAQYRAVLALAPGNAEATAALTMIAITLAQQSMSALRENRMADAERLLADAQAVDGGAPLVAMAKDQLAGVKVGQAKEEPALPPPLAATVQESKSTPPPVTAAAETKPSPAEVVQESKPVSPVPSLLAQADAAFKAGRLSTPREDNALSRYQQALALEPGNAEAQAGLDRIADRYAAMAQRGVEQGEFDKASDWIERGRAIRADRDSLARAAAALAAARSAVASPPAAAASGSNGVTPATQSAPVEIKPGTLQAATAEKALAALDSQAAPARPKITILSSGFEDKFRPMGLKEDELRGAVAERLRALGYDVVEQGGANVLTANLIFHAVFNSMTGWYSYSTSLKFASPQGAPIWSRGDSGIASGPEMAKVRDNYMQLLDRYASERGAARP